MPDLYAILGVGYTATKEQIKAAFRARVRSAHPDTGGSAGAFQQLHRAYKTLIDDSCRAIYDAASKCEVCRTLLSGRKKSFCSKKCRYLSNRRKANIRKREKRRARSNWLPTCLFCGGPKSGNRRRFCSRKCCHTYCSRQCNARRNSHNASQRVYFCESCGFPFKRFTTSKMCNECCEIAEASRHSLVFARCRRCNAEMKVRHRFHRYCSPCAYAVAKERAKRFARKKYWNNAEFRQEYKKRQNERLRLRSSARRQLYRLLRLAGTLAYVSQTLEDTMSASPEALVPNDEMARTVADMNAKGNTELKRIVEEGLNVVKAAILRAACALQILDARGEHCTANNEWLGWLRGIYENRLEPAVIEKYAMKAPEVIKKIARLPVEQQREHLEKTTPEEAKKLFAPVRKKVKPDILEAIIPTDDGLIKIRYAQGLEVLMEPREAHRLGTRIIKIALQMLPSKTPA